MDKRIEQLTGIYRLHARLIDVYHSASSDKQTLMEFCDGFATFAAIIKPPKSPNHFQHLFKAVPELHKKEQLGAHLLAAREYALELQGRIALDPNIVIDNEIVGVLFDYAKLLKGAALAHHLPLDSLAGSRNTRVEAYTSFKIASQFFSHPKPIQRSNTLNGFTIFAIRQALESAAKELLGLRSILRKDGKPDRGNTQLPWKFLVAHAQRPYFQFPFCAQQMQLIYQWSNHFVHTGNDAMCYVTAKALRTVETLFGRMQVCYFDQQPQWVYTNVITDRQAMRRDLETFLLNLDAPRYPQWAPHANLANATG